MNRIINEIYLTVNEDRGENWLIQFSSQTNKDHYGFFEIPKHLNPKNDHFWCLGQAAYQFIVGDGARVIGTSIHELEDALFGDTNEEKYDSRIIELRDYACKTFNAIPYCPLGNTSWSSEEFSKSLDSPDAQIVSSFGSTPYQI